MLEHNSNLVIFGVTGNLAKLKIIPALYDLINHGKLADNSLIIGVGRKDLGENGFVEYIKDVIQEYAKSSQIEIVPEALEHLLKNLRYVHGDITDEEMYLNLKKMLMSDKAHTNTIFYLATYPSLYQHIFESLEKVGLNKSTRGWVRVLVEKPIGNDLSSANALNTLMGQYFNEDQIYRIDHYLGKETVQNILYFRFGNSIFEPIFNKEYIDHIQITSAETKGIGQRGMYYDNVGALKDIGQNHLLQMLALVTMDAPAEMTNDAITKERSKVLAALQPNPEALVLGQYESYVTEENVSPQSVTNTFFALKTEVNTPRFAGVPIYLRGGKMLDKSYAEISVVFKKPANTLFKKFHTPVVSNVLTFRIQPDEGIALRFLSKSQMGSGVLDAADMEFCYKSVAERLLNPYETLISDAIAGDQTFFNDAAEVEAEWKFIDPLDGKHLVPVVYPDGSNGPQEAAALIQKDRREWLEPSQTFCKV
ncbi:glucose-6-phosphate dehydrogenase [soil metagenome]